MKLSLVIDVEVKEQGRDFSRSDLLVSALRVRLPRVLFRDEVEPLLEINDRADRFDAALRLGFYQAGKPAGFDDYILNLNYDIRVVPNQ